MITHFVCFQMNDLQSDLDKKKEENANMNEVNYYNERWS